MKIITAKNYELYDVRRVKNFSVAVMRAAFAQDKLYAWQGNHKAPTCSVIQENIETAEEFLKRANEFFS